MLRPDPFYFLEVTIPALSGPDQDKPWVGVLRKLSEVGYYQSVKENIRKKIKMYYCNLNNIRVIVLIHTNNKL